MTNFILSHARNHQTAIRKVVWVLLGMLLLVELVARKSMSAAYDVTITWSVRESVPAEHTLNVSGKQFTIPAGGSSVQTHRLRGGASVGFLYTTRGWGFRHQKVELDGEELPPAASLFQSNLEH